MKVRVILYAFLMAAIFCCLPLKAQKTADEQKYDRIFMPDSMLTGEQLALKYKIGALVIPNVSVKDGLIVSTLTEKDFADNDIPLYYYRVLQKNISDGNRLVKENGISKEDMGKYFDSAGNDLLSKFETGGKERLISSFEKKTGVSVEEMLAGKIISLDIIGDSAVRSAIRVRSDSVLRSLEDKKRDNETVRSVEEMISGKVSCFDIISGDSAVRSTIRVRGDSLRNVGKSLYNKWLGK